MAQVADKTLLAVLAILACVEKLGSVMNLVAVERDWVCHQSIYISKANRAFRWLPLPARIVKV